jgi:hypothetical protein
MESGDSVARTLSRGKGWVVRAYDEQDRLQAESSPISPVAEAVDKGRAWLADGIGPGLPKVTRVTYQYVAGAIKYPEYDREPEW